MDGQGLGRIMDKGLVRWTRAYLGSRIDKALAELTRTWQNGQGLGEIDKKKGLATFACPNGQGLGRIMDKKGLVGEMDKGLARWTRAYLGSRIDKALAEWTRAWRD